ncbi:leucine-rich repeat protein soc-2-like isoform X2 [Vespa velutina]|uniref:leucine-rich repeat protein soc-2-like isoform X2 n=1 Tax=Vespa velutina TaxID=202808 RepID=UPI001FB51460|nr:leucine-rich repeat protein soc-2-like isoform X2 [Vespa velutina]
MEKDNLKILVYQEQSESTVNQCWPCLIESSNKNSVPMNNYTKGSLNLKSILYIQNIYNSSNKLLPNKLTNLIKLDLSDNYLKDLPDYLDLLKNLQHLILNNNQLSCLPSVIGNLEKLVSLKVHNNNIKEIPENIGNLSNLEDLDLSSNKLRDIPGTYKMLNRLKYLSLANNNFMCTPDCLRTGMCSLEMLDLSQNNHIMLNVPLCSIKIKRFYAKENDICPSFLNWIFTNKYYKLEEVLLDYTVFQKFNFPSEEIPMLNITKLSMIQCQLSEQLLSEIIKRLKCPESLNIGNDEITKKGNTFWVLPIKDIQDKSNLKEINLRKTNIPMIPKCINEFLTLVTIDASCNNITWLPDEICDLHNLQNLIINNNLLVSLPDSIGQLASLKTLIASYNALTCLPSSMMHLNNLQFLDLYDNKFFTATDININMTCLQGIDLEQNYFSTNDLPSYENLRAVLLEYWIKEFREVGLKKESECSDDNESLHSFYSYKINDDELQEVQNSSEWVEENWDDSENSADEFDPNEYWKPKLRQCSPIFAYKRQILQSHFCPADLHAKSILKHFRQMLNNDTFSSNTEFETDLRWRIRSSRFLFSIQNERIKKGRGI